jgi:hypothetical protein
VSGLEWHGYILKIGGTRRVERLHEGKAAEEIKKGKT